MMNGFVRKINVGIGDVRVDESQEAVGPFWKQRGSIIDHQEINVGCLTNRSYSAQLQIITCDRQTPSASAMGPILALQHQDKR